MSRSVYTLAASALALVACQTASEPAETLEAETPPLVEEVVETETVPSTETVAVDEDHDEHDEDGHDDEDHDDHADHDEDEHDHEDHDDHAGGEAHVHGLSELAASLDGSMLSISVEGALANFDLDESLRTLDDPAPYTDGLAEVIGGDCTRDSAFANIRPVGDHGNLAIDLTYTCASPSDIAGIDVIGFQSFSGFEQVNAIFLTDSDQIAETLTESDTRLDIS